ncbi:Zinc finger MYM-type protein 1 [Amphibalanus amphitrite]|uniref:Zinc finger MYM-type protein 1 n=1 Tax=Amphibalanus amphitrite TaxID=1232801 RepID=A0A6A4V4D3_AMPAM|nr:Zinc finger MYM-type protein 1 [Amphibalanus amphitrite]
MVALQDAGAELSLRPLCPTRWTCREGCLASVVSNYGAIQDCLDALAAPGPGKRSGVSATASGLAQQMGTFDFFFCLHLGLHLMRMVTPVMKAVQGQKQTVAENLQMIRTLGTLVDAQRPRFDQFWERVQTARAGLKVGEPKLRRKSTVPRRLDSGGEAYQPENPRDAYRKVFYEAIDMLSQQLRGRSGGDDHVLASAEAALTTGDESAVGECAELYGLDQDRLQLHVSMMTDVARANGKTLKTLSDAVALMRNKSLCIAPLVPEAGKLLRLALVVPATTCTAERSFSMLRRLKSWLRTTMTQERLNHAAICAMYDDVVLAQNKNDLVAEFVSRTAERKALFHVPAAHSSDKVVTPPTPALCLSDSEESDDDGGDQ